MNQKLIGLLIRSNATLIEALSLATSVSDTRGLYDPNQFWGLRQECIALAEEAEAYEVPQQNTVVTSGPTEPFAHREIDRLRKSVEQTPEVTPLIPISPAHLPDPLRLQDVQIGLVFTGKSENTGQLYTAVITETDVVSDVMGRKLALSVNMLTLAGKDLMPFQRRLTEDMFVKEFVSWEK